MGTGTDLTLAGYVWDCQKSKSMSLHMLALNEVALGFLPENETLDLKGIVVFSFLQGQTPQLTVFPVRCSNRKVIPSVHMCTQTHAHVSDG